MFYRKSIIRIYRNIFFIFLFFTSCSTQKNIIERAHLAGTWYPAQASELTNILGSLDSSAQIKFAMQTDGSKIRALIVPHAGYQYSGIIAAAAYRLVKKNIERVIILAPSHFVHFKGVALPPFTRYSLPTGDLLIDTDGINQLKDNPLFLTNAQAFNPEHAAEIQFPLIKYYWKQPLIIPLIINELSAGDIDKVASALVSLITPTTLVIISSDLIHQGVKFNYVPFSENILANVRQLDSKILQAIQANNRLGFKELMDAGATVCGRKPIELLLKMIELNAFGKINTRLVAYGTSADISKDENHLVTYGSLIVTNEIDNDMPNMEEKNSLLRYSRDTLKQSFAPTTEPELLKPILTPLLLKSKGVFVTIYKKENGQKKLRGCVGRVMSTKPLYQLVADMTLESAFKDTRFSPLTAEELNKITLEISILTPPHPVDSYKDIILNKHGIILSVGNKSALFLPRVPQEFGMTFEQTMEELSKKANLSPDAWKSPEAKFQIFESIDFEE